METNHQGKKKKKRKGNLDKNDVLWGQYKINICSHENDKISLPLQLGKTPTRTRGKCPIKAIKEAAIKS